MAEIICAAEPKKNLGLVRCNKLPQQFVRMITTPVGFRLTTAQVADPALAKTALQNALKTGVANRIYLWPDFANLEVVSEEAVYEETPLTDIRVRQGKYRFRAHITKNLCLHKAMFTHSGSEQRVFFLDTEDNLFGTEFSDGTMGGFFVSLLNVEKLMFSDGSVSTKTPVYVVLKNPREIDERGLMIPGEIVSELVPLTDVDIEVLASPAPTTTSFDVSVKTSCDGTPVSGLILADFEILNASGATQETNTTVTETPAGSGIYRCVKTSGSFVDGSVTLVAPSALSIDAYEVTAPATLNVP
jgi:hypothetical protein